MNRVAHVASGDLWAGAERMVFELVQAQYLEGSVEPVLVVMNSGVLARKAQELGVRVFVLDESKLTVLRILIELRRIVRQHGVKLLHTHRGKEHVLGGIVSRITGIPSIRTMHGAPETAARRADFRSKVIAGADVVSARHCQAATVYVAPALRDALNPQIRPARDFIVENGVSVPAENEEVGRQPRELGKRVAIWGRLAPVKRHDVLIEALALSVARGECSWRLHIAGDGPQLNAIAKLARELGVESFVELSSAAEEPWAAFPRPDLIALPSDHEGSPMIVAEAMMRGVPVVAHAVGGLVSMLEGGKAGTLITSQDPAEWVDVIQKVLGQGATEKEKYARTQAMHRYSAKAMAANYDRVYQLILS